MNSKKNLYGYIFLPTNCTVSIVCALMNFKPKKKFKKINLEFLTKAQILLANMRI